MSVKVLYLPGTPNPVRVTGEDVQPANPALMAPFARGASFNETMKVRFRDYTKQKHWPIGGTFLFDRMQIHQVGISGVLLGETMKPVYSVVRTIEHNVPRFKNEPRQFVMVDGYTPPAEGPPADFRFQADRWWRPAREGEPDAITIDVAVPFGRPQEFSAAATHSLAQSTRRNITNAFSAGSSTTVGVEIGGEASQFKVKVEQTLSFDYTRTEESEKSVTEQIGTEDGATVTLEPGEKRVLAFTANHGSAAFKVVKNVFYKGQIGMSWDHDVDFVSGGRGRTYYADAGQTLNWNGVNVEEGYEVGFYSDGAIILDVPRD